MKLTIAALACASVVIAQDYTVGQLKHISVPVAGSAQPLAGSRAGD